MFEETLETKLKFELKINKTISRLTDFGKSGQKFAIKFKKVYK